MNDRLLILGFGYSAQAIANLVRPRFAALSGTSRNLSNVEKFEKNDVVPLLFNDDCPLGDLETALEQASHLLISIAPDKLGDPVLRRLRSKLDMLTGLKWIGYLSTVGVYGNHDGEWVDEESACHPVSQRSIARLEAEKAWRDFAQSKSVPLAILRLSGIYGPGRNAFTNLETGKAKRLIKPRQVFNRIHREDIALATDLAIELNADGIFNITDEMPAPPQDVVERACRIGGYELPPEIDFETADITPMARSFYGENKRVSNTKSKLDLGMVYQWPDYPFGLEKMWREGSWRTD